MDDGQRRFVKSGQDSVAVWMDGSTVEYHEMRSSRNREKKATANLPKLGDSDARLFLRKRRPGNRREPFTIHPSRRAAIASRLKGRCVGEVKMSTWEGPSLPAHFRFLSFQQLEARLIQAPHNVNGLDQSLG